ncbi:T9SS type A sorting domain-containing protein [uncultured Winogradskyella sp.]|uniref:T9SS type A sorting domain-containing protein n=1 Tax=uncultured Winogradskyella sp. TaxID=395353 RepID=UPI00260C4865|nr:T9SS type A sorting domain-containing protein [uncultured Winogradskyella sp.]|tara:strand:+ start:1056 stop:1355 length:300 start_codon:yes stop_codon:yes gene_type:complete
MSGTITVEESLGIDDETINTFKIEKKPVDSNLNITLGQSILEGNVVIYDLLGKQFLTTTISNTGDISFDVSSLKKGLYLVSINSENGTETELLLKNKVL